MKHVFLLMFVLLCSCSSAKKNVENKHVKEHVSNFNFHIDEVENTKQYIEMKEKIIFSSTGELLDHSNELATQKPDTEKFVNSTTVYNYVPGGIYKVYTAPMRVTMLSMEPGERLTAPPQGGDTVRWNVKYVTSNSLGVKQQHIIIKPTREGLNNNIILTTNRGRKYFLDLTSFKNSYMTSVAWKYPKKKKIKTQTNNVYSDYLIKTKRKVGWQPDSVHDDGNKTYIKFPDKINQLELPALYIVSSESSSQLVNYRYNDNTMIVDRLFNTAELRLGIKRPETIKIIRKDNV